MISFVVIGRNEGWRLEKCFKGILDFVETEHISDYEVIYVDSQSTDNSIELSKSCNTKTFLITGECNAAIARNIGAKEAKGDILFFLDGDMELIPGFYSSIIHEGRLVYPFVSGIENDILHNDQWERIGERLHRKYKEGHDAYEVTTGGLFIIDANLWRKVGGMDNRQRRSQDLDLGLRLTKMGYKLCRKPQIWVNHYTKDYQIRKDAKTFDKYKAILVRKHIYNFTAQRFLFGVNYTVWMLVLSVLLMMAFKSWFPIILYVLVLGYRSYRDYRRNAKTIHLSLIYYRQIMSDFSFLYHFVTYWPQNVEELYDVK